MALWVVYIVIAASHHALEHAAKGQLHDKKLPESLVYEEKGATGEKFECNFRELKYTEKDDGSYSSKCWRMFNGMTHFRDDGTAVYPYFKEGTGLALNCTSMTIPGRTFESDCKRKLMDSCQVTCHTGFQPQNSTVTCQLQGNYDNVTAGWSPPKPCLPQDPEMDKSSNGSRSTLIILCVLVGVGVMGAVCFLIIYVIRHKIKLLEKASTKTNSDGTPDESDSMFETDSPDPPAGPIDHNYTGTASQYTPVQPEEIPPEDFTPNVCQMCETGFEQIKSSFSKTFIDELQCLVESENHHEFDRPGTIEDFAVTHWKDLEFSSPDLVVWKLRVQNKGKTRTEIILMMLWESGVKVGQFLRYFSSCKPAVVKLFLSIHNDCDPCRQLVEPLRGQA